jgi:RND family efflux transporter MFP subunit
MRVVAVLVAGVLVGCNAAVPTVPKKVAPEASTPGQPAAREPWTGVLSAQGSYELAAETGGRVVAVHVAMGDVVVDGGVVVSLDDTTVRRQLAETSARRDGQDAAQRVAALEVQQARLRARTDQKLLAIVPEETRASSTLASKQAEARRHVARAEASAAAASVARLEHELSLSSVRATRFGRVAAIYATEGAMVSAGQPLLRLVDDSEVRVRFVVPVKPDAGLVRAGTTVAVRCDHDEVTRLATIERWSAEIEVETQLLTVEAVLPGSADLDLPPGAACLVTPTVPPAPEGQSS